MSNGSNFMYVAPDVAPSETFSESFGKIGERMRQAGVANQQARQEAQRLAAQNQRSLMAQRNSQYNALLNVGKNTENFSMADLEELNDLKMQSLEKFQENPDLFANLLTNLTTHYNMGKKHAQLKTGAFSAADEYIALLGNTRDFRGPEGMMPILSAEDFQTKNKSYDQMGEKTGERFTDPTTGLEMDVFNYYNPGSLTTYDASFRQKHSGAEIQRVEDQNGTVKLVAIQNGAPIDEQVVSGPLIFYPERGSGKYFTPQTINIERTTPEDFLSGRGGGINHVVTNVRGQVQAKEITEDQARVILAESVSRVFNSPSGTGMQAAAVDMWNQTYGEQYGQFNPEIAETYQLQTPLQMFTDTFLDLANVSYKEPASSSGSTRQSQFAEDSKRYSVKTGLPDAFVQDQQDEKRGVLYQNMDEELQSYGTNTQELIEGKRVHIHVPHQKLLYRDRKFENIEVYLDQNIIMLEKADNYEGKESSRTTSNRWSPERLNDRYWSSLPEKKYDIIQIYDAQGNPTDAMNDLMLDFAKAYGSDPQVNENTLMQIIAEKFSQQ